MLIFLFNVSNRVLPLFFDCVFINIVQHADKSDLDDGQPLREIVNGAR